MSRAWMKWTAAALLAAVVVGCGGKVQGTGSAGSAGPSLDSKNADERAAAAREAAQKYGARP